MHIKHFLLLILLAVQITISCKREIVCTEEFRSLHINIYEQDSLITPDAWYMVRFLSNDTILNYQTSPYQNTDFQGGIVIFTDNEMKYTNSKEGEVFIFTAYRDTTHFIEELYIIKHDDCHFVLISGNTEIIIQ